MVDTNELVKLLKVKQKENSIRLATVTELFENGTAKITFYGEEAASQKGYCYLESFEPAAGDTVLMIPIADTYIIIGKILLQTDLPSGIITPDELDLILNDYLTQTGIATILEGYALANHTHSIYALTVHTHNTYSLTTHNHSDTYAPVTHNHNKITDGLYSVTFGTVNGSPALIPSVSYMCLGGLGSWRWEEIYSKNGIINTSDKRQKKFIKSISDKYKEFFVKIRPVTYKFKKNSSDRTHIGFIAQEIESAMNEQGMDSKDFAGFIKSPILDKEGNIKEYEYGLRYSEFIALNTHMIQQLMKSVEVLENKVNILETN